MQCISEVGLNTNVSAQRLRLMNLLVLHSCVSLRHDRMTSRTRRRYCRAVRGATLRGPASSSAQSFQDHLGRVRGTKSKIEDGYAEGTARALCVAVGDFAGAQPLRVQVVLELSHFLLLSAALSRPLPSAHRRWVCCLTLSSKLVGPLERVAQHHHAHTLLVCAHDAARALSSEVTS